MNKPIYLILLFIGLISCEKATVVQQEDSFCPDSIPQEYSVSGSVIINGDSFALNYLSFDELIDSTWELYFQNGLNSGLHYGISLGDIVLNDTVVYSDSTSSYNLSIGNCDQRYPCVWTNTIDTSNYVFAQSTNTGFDLSFKIKTKLNSMSGASCEFYNGNNNLILAVGDIKLEEL